MKEILKKNKEHLTQPFSWKLYKHINFRSNQKVKNRLFGTIPLLKITIKPYFTNIGLIKVLNILNKYLIADINHSIPFSI